MNRFHYQLKNTPDTLDTLDSLDKWLREAVSSCPGSLARSGLARTPRTETGTHILLHWVSIHLKR